MLKKIAARTKNKDLYDFFPQHITPMDFYPDPTVRDIIGFGSLLWDQYREVDYCTQLRRAPWKYSSKLLFVLDEVTCQKKLSN